MKVTRKSAVIALVTALSLGALNNGYAAETFSDPEQQQQRYDQNMKQEKIDFVNQKSKMNVISSNFIMDQITQYQLFAGTVVPGILQTGLNSDLPGQVVGIVSQNVFDSTTGKWLLIPQGTKVIGTYDAKTSFAQTRGLVVWQRLIFPDGRSIVLDNFVGTDQSGYSGFHDKVRSHYSRVVWTALLGGAITGGVAAATSTDSDDNSFKAEAGAAAAQNISNAVNSIVNKNLNIAPTIMIRPGYQFNIMIEEDLLLEPYEEE
ncbi:TrbI/VirB10 family protein [Phascolarctobacterium sp.]